MTEGSETAAEDRSQIDRLVAVVDRLRSPGGCPWDAEQTHLTLAPFCLEEAYEAVDAIETGDAAAMRDELGDVLLQVVIHARVSQDEDPEPFTLEDIARSCADKLIRRHPHVFDAGSERAADAADSHRRWDRVKASETGRASVFDGIPRAQGALARAGKLLARAERADLIDIDKNLPLAAPVAASERSDDGQTLAWAALDLVRRATANGIDLEGEVRRRTRVLEAELRSREEEGDTAHG